MKLITTSKPNLTVAEESVTDIATWRGLPAAVLATYGIRYAEPDSERPGWIEIPYPNLSGIWHHRYRNPNPQDKSHRYHQARGTGVHLYNPLNLGPNSDEVWMAEGEFDTLALIAAGLPALGVPGATGFHRTWHRLFSDAHVIIAFDPDDHGRAASVKLASAFRDVFVFEWPDAALELCAHAGEKPDWNAWWKIDSDDMTESLEAWRRDWGIIA